MNFETEESRFKKDLWFLKAQKLIKDFDNKTTYEDEEQK